MNILAELQTIIATLESVIKLVETIDPNAAKNPLVIKLQSVLTELQAFNL